MMKKRLINIFICCIISIYGKAQTEGYKFYADIDTIKVAGFYNIALTPAINAHLKIDYSDVRIVNSEGRWVPHVLFNPSHNANEISIKKSLPFSVAENNKTNTVILITTNKNSLNNIGLVLKNTAAERFCKISGSEDRNKWFVINDSILIDPNADEVNTETDFRIDFPKSNYTYYKLEIINSNKDPFNIKNIVCNNFGTKKPTIKSTEIQNPANILQQKDSAKTSYIKVTQQQAFHFDMLHLKLTGSKYFSRKIGLYIPYNEENSFSNIGTLVETFTISNNSALHFNFVLQASKVFYLLIDNEDNLPLSVKEVSTSINEHYITSYLEMEQQYKLIVGNEMATLPNYDLQKTFPILKDSLPTLGIKEIISIKEKNIPTKVIATNNNKWIIWGALVLGLLIMLLLTRKMMKEVDKKTTNDTI